MTPHLITFRRALLSRGVDVSLTTLAELCGRDGTLMTLAECAKRFGLKASLVRLSAGDLAFVKPGALVAMRDGAVGVVISVAPTEVTIETGPGARLRVDVRSASATDILEIGNKPASGAGILSRMAAVLRDDPRAQRAIVIAVMVGLLLSALGLSGPVLTRAALGSALPNHAESMLQLVAVATALIGLQIAWLGWVRRRALRYVVATLAKVTSTELTAHALSLPFAHLRALQVGTVQQTVGAASRAAETLVALAPQLLDVVTAVGYLAYVFAIDRTVGAVVAPVGLALFLGGAVAGRARLAAQRALLQRSRDEQQCLYETIAGIETVKAEAASERFLTRWLDKAIGEQRAALVLRAQGAVWGIIASTLNTAAAGAVLLIMAERCLAGEAVIADLVAAGQAAASFMASAQGFAQLPTIFATLRADVERADATLSVAPDAASGGSQGDPNAPALALRDVWFRYDDSVPWLFSRMDLTIQRGQVSTLHWPSGAGKSTLLRLLSGLLAPTRGDVLVCGMDASRGRHLVTYIPQQASLCPGSVMENLQILSRSARRDRIMAAAEATGLLDLVAGWGMGLETVIALGGANLSSGQRQLVLLTAAVASETPIVLLDEALAHMDSSMRARLMQSDLFVGRTVIMVTHAEAEAVGGARLSRSHGREREARAPLSAHLLDVRAGSAESQVRLA